MSQATYGRQLCVTRRRFHPASSRRLDPTRGSVGIKTAWETLRRNPKERFSICGPREVDKDVTKFMWDLFVRFVCVAVRSRNSPPPPSVPLVTDSPFPPRPMGGKHSTHAAFRRIDLQSEAVHRIDRCVTDIVPSPTCSDHCQGYSGGAKMWVVRGKLC